MDLKLLSLIGLAGVRGRDLLSQPVRRRLVDLISDQPGIHASELCRQADESWGAVQYHLSLLDKADLIKSVSSGRERRFFRGGVEDGLARRLALVRQGRRQEIAEFIGANPGCRQVDVCKALGVSRKTFRAAINSLSDEGLVLERKGQRNNIYYPQAALQPVLGASGEDAPGPQRSDSPFVA
ncbi:MAG: winged helix-turn-helix transcriptional regulator [Thermoplasmatota archaeon]